MKEHELDLGACCACESTENVRNILSLNYKAPPGTISAWGCFPCNLPTEGAIAVLCDDCIERPDIEADLKFILKDVKEQQPVPPIEAREPFSHNDDNHNLWGVEA